MAKRKRVPERRTIKAMRDRMPAQSPRAKGALADVHAGQSPIWPIPMGRPTARSSSTKTSINMIFISSQITVDGRRTRGLAFIHHRTLRVKPAVQGHPFRPRFFKA